MSNTIAILETNLGTITVKLNDEKAPKSVANFIQYAKDGHYDGTIFHRVINNFMIQGGGFAPGMKQKEYKYAPITNEANNGLKNAQYTLAMARTNDPHSATAQFFINVNDNDFLNHSVPTPQGWGYAVFGVVTDGQTVVDTIKGVKTGSVGFHQDVPKEDVVLQKVTILNAGEVVEKITPAIQSLVDFVSGAIDAGANAEVVEDDRLVPVLSKELAPHFVRELAKLVSLQGKAVATAPLRVGSHFDLLGISQSTALLAEGILDSTDAIDPNITLAKLYLKVPGLTGDEFVLIDLDQVPLTNFSAQPEGNYRTLQVNLVTNIELDASTRTIKNLVLSQLGQLFDKGVKLPLRLTVSGVINLQTGETSVYGKVFQERVDMPVGSTPEEHEFVHNAVAAIGKGIELVGFDLNSKRVNHNHMKGRRA